MVAHLCPLLYSNVLSTVVQSPYYFKLSKSRSKHENSSDVAGTTVLFKIKIRFKMFSLFLVFVSYVLVV